MITPIVRTVLHCKCRFPDCRHEWDTFTKPKRCAGCKRVAWNGEDNRRKDPYEFVPKNSLLETGKGLPGPRLRSILNALTVSRDILVQVIADLGPCDHRKNLCVCQEQNALDRVNKEIEELKKFIPAARVAS